MASSIDLIYAKPIFLSESYDIVIYFSSVWHGVLEKLFELRINCLECRVISIGWSKVKLHKLVKFLNSLQVQVVCGPEDGFNKGHQIRNFHRVPLAAADSYSIFLQNISTSNDQIAGLNEIQISYQRTEFLVFIDSNSLWTS